MPPTSRAASDRGLGWKTLLPMTATVTGRTLVVAVTVEITANPIGLGYALIVAQESMKPDRMFVFLVWIGFLGWIVNAVLLRAQQRWFGRMGNWAEQER